MVWIATLFAVAIACGVVLVRWGVRWGSTAVERARPMPGDEYLDDGTLARVAMTRAVSIAVPPQRVWPWIAQLGRGAGWYSVDGLDNGRKRSARHLVSWIPEPRLGDSTAIGYLRHLQLGSAVAWWVDGVGFAGSQARLVSTFVVYPDGPGTRLVSRMSADATGSMAQFALLVFRFIDSIMACRQLIGIRARILEYGLDPTAQRDAETGERDQYQLHEVLFAAGGAAGVAGREHASRWRQSAIEDGVLKGTD